MPSAKTDADQKPASPLHLIDQTAPLLGSRPATFDLWKQGGATDALRQHGYEESDIAKILGANFVRVLSAVREARAR